jgi:hypothetical protein
MHHRHHIKWEPSSWKRMNTPIMVISGRWEKMTGEHKNGWKLKTTSIVRLIWDHLSIVKDLVPIPKRNGKVILWVLILRWPMQHNKNRNYRTLNKPGNRIESILWQHPGLNKGIFTVTVRKIVYYYLSKSCLFHLLPPAKQIMFEVKNQYSPSLPLLTLSLDFQANSR